MFELLKIDPYSKARLGRLTTPHGVVDTPVFMPVGEPAAAEGSRTPRVLGVRRSGWKMRQLLDCASPLALSDLRASPLARRLEIVRHRQPVGFEPINRLDHG